MNCRDFEGYAERWMEGQQHGQAGAHLQECSSCRGYIADLEAIRDAATQLAEDVAPPPQLWVSIRTQLEKEGVIYRTGWREQLAELFRPGPRPVLVGSLVAVAAAAILTIYNTPTPQQPAIGWNASNQSAFGPVATQLDLLEHGAVPVMHEHNPVVQASFHQNLAIVDNSIQMCEKALQESPEDEMAREYLYDAYQQKADLLTTIAERGSVVK